MKFCGGAALYEQCPGIGIGNRHRLCQPSTTSWRLHFDQVNPIAAVIAAEKGELDVLTHQRSVSKVIVVFLQHLIIGIPFSTKATDQNHHLLWTVILLAVKTCSTTTPTTLPSGQEFFHGIGDNFAPFASQGNSSSCYASASLRSSMAYAPAP